jgi:hypothetical protein
MSQYFGAVAIIAYNGTSMDKSNFAGFAIASP